MIDIIYQLMQSEETLKAENSELKRRLQDQEIKIGNAGSIAEASLALSGIFESAQIAAEIFFKQYKAEGERILEQAKTEAEKYRSDAGASKTDQTEGSNDERRS